MKKKNYPLRGFILIAFVVITYYIWLPPLHFQSPVFWGYAIVIALLAMFLFIGGIVRKEKIIALGNAEKRIVYYTPKKTALKFVAFLVVFTLLLGIGGFISSTPVFHAKSYANLIHKESADFDKEIPEADPNKILTVDKDTAIRLGNRKMGEVVELVSQFTVSDEYAQINYQGLPVRVSPLQYASPIKWLTNMSEGIPYYMKVNMINGETKLVKCETPIKYSKSEYFNRMLLRHLRFQYPFKLFYNSVFEINEEGHPYWITPVYHKMIGLFGGPDVTEVILTDACSGKSELMKIKDVPTWVDRAYDSDLILQQINWNGEYQKGFINAHIGQKGVLATTKGYNYLALNDDVYVYTGITSVSSDDSNIGFVLVNMRTKECKFYSVPSAEEFSAMESAQGAVQEKNYKATFPLLYNVNTRPTYFLSLKDQAGLIKMYAFIDAENYQHVVTGTTVNEAYKTFVSQMNTMPKDKNKTNVEQEKISGKIADVKNVVIEGNTYYYFILEGSPTVYIAAATLNEKLPFIHAGTSVELSVDESKGSSKRVNDIEIT